jgi:hypothetical protein
MEVYKNPMQISAQLKSTKKNDSFAQSAPYLPSSSYLPSRILRRYSSQVMISYA